MRIEDYNENRKCRRESLRISDLLSIFINLPTSSAFASNSSTVSFEGSPGASLEGSTQRAAVEKGARRLGRNPNPRWNGPELARVRLRGGKGKQGRVEEMGLRFLGGKEGNFSRAEVPSNEDRDVRIRVLYVLVIAGRELLLACCALEGLRGFR